MCGSPVLPSNTSIAICEPLTPAQKVMDDQRPGHRDDTGHTRTAPAGRDRFRHRTSSTSASGSEPTLASRITRPVPSPMHTLELSKDTSIPALCSIAVPIDAWSRTTLTPLHRHSEGQPPFSSSPAWPRPVTLSKPQLVCRAPSFTFREHQRPNGPRWFYPGTPDVSFSRGSVLGNNAVSQLSRQRGCAKISLNKGRCLVKIAQATWHTIRLKRINKRIVPLDVTAQTAV